MHWSLSRNTSWSLYEIISNIYTGLSKNIPYLNDKFLIAWWLKFMVLGGFAWYRKFDYLQKSLEEVVKIKVVRKLGCHLDVLLESLVVSHGQKRLSIASEDELEFVSELRSCQKRLLLSFGPGWNVWSVIRFHTIPLDLLGPWWRLHLEGFLCHQVALIWCTTATSHKLARLRAV